MSEFASGGEPLAQQLPVADELHQSSQTESQDHELEEIEVIELEEEARPTQGQGQEPPGRSSSPSQEQPQEPRLQRRKVRAENKEPKPDTRQCRICFAGAEEEPELGRLIKPCRCKGSIRVSSNEIILHITFVVPLCNAVWPSAVRR